MPKFKLPPLGPGHKPGEAVLEILEHTQPYKNFLRIDTYSIRSRRFDGTLTEAYEREVMSLGTAVAAMILPYDPQLDSVILIEQLRLPSFISKRTNGWTLEAPAGLVDHGVDPQATARRECLEECNREPGRIIKIGHYLPSPGSFAEVMHLFVGEVKAGQGGEIAGLSTEHEYIRTHVIDFSDAMELVDTDMIDNGNTLIALNWLARHRDRVRKEWLENKA